MSESYQHFIQRQTEFLDEVVEFAMLGVDRQTIRSEMNDARFEIEAEYLLAEVEEQHPKVLVPLRALYRRMGRLWDWSPEERQRILEREGRSRQESKAFLKPNRDLSLDQHVKKTRREFQKHAEIIRAFVFERDGYRCVGCQATEPLEVDHIVPVTKWGGNSPANLQTLCKPCNIRKGNRPS